jgi:ABC-type transport system substrate-binding protein
MLAHRHSYGESRAKYGGTLDASINSETMIVDPIAAASVADLTLISYLHESLYRLDDNDAVPTLAAAAPQFETPLRARITLRSGLTFHDGTAITPSDVAASLLRLRASSNGYLIAAVANVRVEASAVVVVLTQAAPNLASLLAMPQAAITIGGKIPVTNNPVGAGPFAWSTRNASRRFYELNAFDNYVKTRPFVDKLRLHWFSTSDAEARRFETGAAHVSLRGATAFSGAQPKYVSMAIESEPAALWFIGFGQRSFWPRQAGFRRALDIGIARNGLLALGAGEKLVPTRLPLLRSTDSNTNVAGDMDAARREIAAVTKPNAVIAAVEVLVDASMLDDHEIAERVVRVLDKLAIPAVVSVVDSAVFADRVSRRDVDLYVGQMMLPTTVAPLWWNASFAAGNVRAGDSPATQAAVFSKELPIVPLMHKSVRAWVRGDVSRIHFDALGLLVLDDASVIGRPVASVPSKATQP